MTSRIVELGVIPSEDKNVMLLGYLKIEAVCKTGCVKEYSTWKIQWIYTVDIYGHIKITVDIFVLY